MRNSILLMYVIVLIITVRNVMTSNDERETYVEAFPREGFNIPLYDWDPQHRSHIANGWANGRSPWTFFKGGLPPRPPKDPGLPTSSPSPSPTPYTETPTPTPTNDELCIPSPDCVEPHTGPISGGVRVTIQGNFLARKLEDIKEVRLCGVRLCVCVCVCVSLLQHSPTIPSIHRFRAWV